MKVKIEREIKPLYIYIILGIIVFVLLSFFQCNRSSGLKEDLKESREKVTGLESTNEDLKTNNEELIEEGEFLKEEIISVNEQRVYYKDKYYVTNKKLKIIIINFNALSIEDRFDALTKSLHE